VLALILALATTAAPAPTPTPLATAEQLYEGAIARLAALRQAPYLSYEMDQTSYTRAAGIILDMGQMVTERRADRAFHNVVTYGGNGLAIGRHYLTPDEFIPDVSAPLVLDGTDPTLDTPAATPTVGPAAATLPSAAPDFKTIAVVSTTTSYKLTSVDDVVIQDNFCGEAAHIKLDPKRDSSVFNVRELWIRRSDFALCAAIFNSWSFSSYGHLPSVDAVWLDERGFIVHWRCEFQDGTFNQGDFKNIKWQDSVPSGLYFSH